MTTPKVRDLFDLSGVVALVTGASGSIGQSIAERLSEAGAAVAIHYGRDMQSAESVRGRIEKSGGSAITVSADLSEAASIGILFDEVSSGLDVPTILVNCAALQSVVALDEMTLEDWSSLMQVNLDAPFLLTKEFVARVKHAPESKKTSSPSIINITSIEGSRPAKGHAHYATSKAALEMFTRASALEYGAYGIRVNAVAPGLIARPGIEENWPEGVGRWKAAAPLGRLGDPTDVADAVLFLSSRAARWITGATLVVDGGVTAGPGW